MAGNNNPTLYEMIAALREGADWERNLGKAPAHVQYYVINVAMMEAMPEAQYAREFPDWAAAIEQDYGKLLETRKQAVDAKAAAELAESAAVKRIQGLTDEQWAKLAEMLAVKPPDNPPAA